MTIDVLFLLFMAMAVYKGMRKGFLLAVLSAVALIIGLAAAIRLSAAVAGFLKVHTHWSAHWLPLVSFLLVFAAVVIGVRWMAKWIEELVDLVMLGWLNRLAGVLLYACLYAVIFSIFLFYARQVHAVSDATLSSSVSYRYIRPWGPEVIDGLGKFIPWFKDMFIQLEDKTI